MNKYKDGYGVAPRVIGDFDISINEMMFYMYMPIKMAGEVEFIIPERLSPLRKIVWAAVDALNDDDYVQRQYVYVTAKHVHVSPEYRGNRKGWHCDGFMTDDINFIWMDACPTEFAIQPISIVQDDYLSMQQMESDVQENSIATYPLKQLLMLDQHNIHRVSESDKYFGMRTFIKISFSNNQYNLKGNSHNYLMDYNWRMHERNSHRNVTDVKINNQIREAV